MSKWLQKDHYRKISQFLGKKVVWLFSLGVVVGLFVYVVELMFAYGIQAFLMGIGVMDSSIVVLPSWMPKENLGAVLVFFVVVGTVRCFLQWAQLYLQGLTAEELRSLLRGRILRWAFFSESVSSSQATVLLNDRTNYASAFVQAVQVVTIQLTCGILLGFSLLFLAPTLTVILAVCLGVLLLPMRGFDRKIAASGMGLTVEGERINRQLLDGIRNLLLMHIYGTHQREEEKAQERSYQVRRFHLEYYWYNALKFALPNFVGLVLICLITFVAKAQGTMAPGNLLTYFYLFVRFLQTTSGAVQGASPVIHYWPQVTDLARWWADHSFDGLRNQRNVDTSRSERQADLPGPIGWELNGLSFSYPGSQDKLFHDLRLHVEPGRCFVMTGPSGVGKSTLLNLMLGGIQPTVGSVELVFRGGAKKPLAEVRSHLFESVGYVGTESFLQEGSIHDNLVYGLRQVPSVAKVKEACLKAECQFIFEMPEGLNHQLTEQGQGLSAGQKQRLSLARALLREPTVLILDEATANLDMETERRLVETLEQLKGEMTIVAVTHKPALLRIADQQLRLEGLQASKAMA